MPRRNRTNSDSGFLEERVVAPALVTERPSTRLKTEKRAERRFAPRVVEWAHFRQNVLDFQYESEKEELPYFQFNTFIKS